MDQAMDRTDMVAAWLVHRMFPADQSRPAAPLDHPHCTRTDHHCLVSIHPAPPPRLTIRAKLLIPLVYQSKCQLVCSIDPPLSLFKQ